MAGVSPASSLSKSNWTCTWVTFWFARVLSHAAIVVCLAVDHSFPRGVEFPMAMCGILCFNMLNIELGRDLLRAHRKEQLPAAFQSARTRGPGASKVAVE